MLNADKVGVIASTLCTIHCDTADTNSDDPAACQDLCCPSLIQIPDGTQSLNIPAASILTTAGGLFLIITHIGNLCRCKSCGKGCPAAA